MGWLEFAILTSRFTGRSNTLLDLWGKLGYDAGYSREEPGAGNSSARILWDEVELRATRPSFRRLRQDGHAAKKMIARCRTLSIWSVLGLEPERGETRERPDFEDVHID